MPAPRDVIELLQDLVAIPSVNPAGNPGTEATGEAAVANYVADFLRNLGAEVRLDDIEPGRPNVVAKFRPEGRPTRAHLAFAPHFDTVSVSGMTIAPFDPVVREGKFLWPRFQRHKRTHGRSVVGFARLVAKLGPRAIGCGLDISRLDGRGGWSGRLARGGRERLLQRSHAGAGADVARRGYGAQGSFCGWIVETTGVACHGSAPENGRSAIYAMRRVLEIIETKMIPELAQRAHPSLGPCTVNVGTIRGGSKINIVPDACRIELDCRLVPGVEAETFAYALAGRSARSGAGCKGDRAAPCRAARYG